MALPPILALTTEPTSVAASVQWKARVGRSHTRTGFAGAGVSVIGIT